MYNSVDIMSHNEGAHWCRYLRRPLQPGQQLNAKKGQLILAGVSIKGVKSTHKTVNNIDRGNYINTIDMAGLRIAHFGDIGQDELNPTQLDTLGDVAIALTQFGAKEGEDLQLFTQRVTEFF